MTTAFCNRIYIATLRKVVVVNRNTVEVDTGCLLHVLHLRSFTSFYWKGGYQLSVHDGGFLFLFSFCVI